MNAWRSPHMLQLLREQLETYSDRGSAPSPLLMHRAGPLPNNRLTTQPALGWVGDLRSGGAENARNNALVGALYVTYFLVVRVNLFPLAGIS
jgi:hypothetical protein